MLYKATDRKELSPEEFIITYIEIEIDNYLSSIDEIRKLLNFDSLKERFGEPNISLYIGTSSRS